MIKQFGLEGYRYKIVKLFQSFFKKKEWNFKTEKGAIVIDSNQFCTIELKRFDGENNYLYSSLIFIGEISEKEVSCLLIFDNQQDKDLLVNSLVKLKFKK